ncbi:hypothetical protein ACQ4PT_009696 [Festuca glaucescens]
MKPMRGAPDAMADPALPKKEAMATTVVDAVAAAVAVAACDPGRGNPSPAVVGTVDNPVQEQTGDDLAVGMLDLSAVAGVVASLKMSLDPPVDATEVDRAEGAAVSKYTGNGNDDGSDEEKVADQLNEVGSKKRVYGTDFDPYDTDSDVEHKMKDGRESFLANHANSVATSNPKTFKERAKHKALAHFFFGDKLPDYSMKRKKNRY